MNLKTKFFILLIIVMQTAFACSCAPKDPYDDDERDDTTLQVYLIQWSFEEIDAINIYNAEVKAGNIDGRLIEVTEFEIEEVENMYERISSEMMSGEGPDIIFIDRRFSSYLDFVKMSEQDAFADFDILIEKSNTFSMEDYNQDALNAGIINEKRIMIPLSYNVNYIITTQKNMDTLEFPIPEHLTYSQLFEMNEKWHNETNSVGDVDSLRYLLYGLISNEGLDPQSAEDLKKYMDIESEITNRQGFLGANSTLSEHYQKICSGDYLMGYSRNINGGSAGTPAFLLLGDLYNMVENLFNEDFVMINDPVVSPDVVYGYINLGCAVSMNSTHKNDAFKFVEFLLSEQCQYGAALKIASLPLNIDAYEKAKTDFLNNTLSMFYNGIDTYYPKTPLPDELKDYYIELVESVSEYKYTGQIDYIIKNVLGYTIDNYRNGKIDFDTMVEEINRKIKLYYSE